MPHTCTCILGYVYLVVGELYMLASTVSSKILQTIGNKEGFQFEVVKLHQLLCM